jgi:YggT family protein
VIDEIVSATAYVLVIAIFCRAILSWFIQDPRNPIMDFLITITEPILAPIRSIMPRGMMIDFSPMIASFLIIIVAQIIVDNI